MMGQQFGLLFARGNRMSLNFSLWNLPDRHTNDGKKGLHLSKIHSTKKYTVWYHVIQIFGIHTEDFLTELSKEIAVLSELNCQQK